MSNLHVPPHIQATIDQQNADMRNLLDADLKLYRQHIDEVHGGEPTPCAKSAVLIRHLPFGESPLGQMRAIALAAYAVERLVILERELARRVEAAQ